ncbi:hypothetical protein LCGC14_2001940 [marine sediment metagenome]|uniref:MPN domain-containing protein n=1 Tax=marine sediment metagenome TaxID=412755 RepID=A0A0F9I017_9ZZZZ
MSPRILAGKVDTTLSKMRKLHDELNRALRYSPAKDCPYVRSPHDAADLVMYDMSHLEQEQFRILLLNNRNRVLSIETIYTSTLNSALIRIAEVFRPAILRSSAAIVLIHNHPSGDPTPSPEDLSITRTLVEAGRILDIDVLDHIVIGCGCFVSMKERGLGFEGTSSNTVQLN